MYRSFYIREAEAALVSSDVDTMVEAYERLCNWCDDEQDVDEAERIKLMLRRRINLYRIHRRPMTVPVPVFVSDKAVGVAALAVVVVGVLTWAFSE